MKVPCIFCFTNSAVTKAQEKLLPFTNVIFPSFHGTLINFDLQSMSTIPLSKYFVSSTLKLLSTPITLSNAAGNETAPSLSYAATSMQPLSKRRVHISCIFETSPHCTTPKLILIKSKCSCSYKYSNIFTKSSYLNKLSLKKIFTFTISTSIFRKEFRIK